MSGISVAEERQNPAFYALVFALIVMALGPIVMMISTSLKFNVDIMSGSSGLLFMPTLANYETVLCDVLWYTPERVEYCDPTFGRALKNSLIIALVSTAFTLIIGTMAAYALVRFRFMGRGTVSMASLMMRMVPPAVLLVPVFGIWTFDFCFGDECLAGTYSGVILVYVAMNLPFVIWILQSFIVQVPVQLEEAARVDGANPFQVFFLLSRNQISPFHTIPCNRNHPSNQLS
ncbi:MAG: carbohydrate ABC transporter permease [Granulosicoccaceae bacterium]